MGNNPSHFKGADRPVETVSWSEVTSFCEKLTELEREADRLPPGMTYQLPTEAQWEYACRAGTTTDFAFGDELTEKDANSEKSMGKTTDVGKYPANAWGFHDMHGNVWEWTADWFLEFTSDAVSDPVGPTDGSVRVRRGGSWFHLANSANSAFRSRYDPAYRSEAQGFRLSLRPARAQAKLDGLAGYMIILKAFDGSKLQRRGKEGKELIYASNEQTPYTGCAKWMHDNGQIKNLIQLKDGKPDGLAAAWYENRQMKMEEIFKDGKLVTAVSWKPNGEKCPVTNVVDGNGFWVEYNEDGTVSFRLTYKGGVKVED
jgi:hypothetical protein